MSSPSAVGRRRGLPKQMSSEDQALNLIAKEAEARLAAKRAARAEARSIRMKELEKKQQEADEEYDKYHEDEEEESNRKKVPPSRIASSTVTYNSEPPAPVVGDQQLKESLRESEEKYKKAMVNNAQLDNERQALQYQVECLKDIIEDLEENLENHKDELTDKIKDLSKLTRDHTKTTEELQKCCKLLEDRERILDEHGINLDGTLKIDNGENEFSYTDGVNGIPDHKDGEMYAAEKASLMSEIQTLKEELSELRSQNENDGQRRGTDHMKHDRVDLERSFVDVSTEAHAIVDSGRHSGMYVNNNEKCEEFEVIDDGSQVGGIKNFEDKSFEKSGRSSLMSSIQAGVEESMESEKPFEISVDIAKVASKGERSQPEEYDIVQMEDSTKHQSDDCPTPVGSSEERESLPPAPIDINLNKYVAAADDENSSEKSNSPAKSLNIDKYFDVSTDETAEVVVPEDTDRVSPVLSEDGIDQIDIDESEQDSQFQEFADEAVRCSPYVDVDTELSQEVEITSTYQDISTKEEQGSDYVSLEHENEVLESTETLEEHTNACDSDRTLTKSDTLEESNDAPKILSAGVFSEQSTENSAGANVMTQSEDNEVRQDVVNFYEQIVGESDEANTSPEPLGTNESTATFGVFGKASEVPPANGEFENNSLASPKKPQGWLVRVESFTAPKSSAPEIKVVAEEPASKSTDNTTPKGKKKKKKKKKKGNKTGHHQPSAAEESPDECREDAPAPTAPELLGFVEDHKKEDEEVSPRKQRTSVNDPDIPQQFLDVSNDLAADSMSDLSDVEVGEDGLRKRNNSTKRGSKKESCKTQ